MNPETLQAILDAVIADRRLLTHPFYLRWQAGTVRRAELTAYAGQYRHVEAALPETLARCVAQLPASPARDLVAANLDDELGAAGDPSHLDLFGRFAAALDATRAVAPTPATAELVDTYRDGAARGPVAALATVAAYEMQAADVATSKGDGLRRWYGMDSDATRFWDVHAELDDAHRRWMLEALASLAQGPADVAGPARRAADAWWAFLDEREAAGVDSV